MGVDKSEKQVPKENIVIKFDCKTLEQDQNKVNY